MKTYTTVRAKCIYIVSGLLLAALAPAGRAQLVRWSQAEGGNDHFYQVVAMGRPLTWTEANDLAQSVDGHLVTLTSEAENEFVFGLIDEDAYWYKGYNWRGPWIGAYQPTGILTRLLADGTNVVLVYGKTHDDLKTILADLSF